MKQWLEEVGFTSVKIWAQPMNNFYKDGQAFVNNMAGSRIQREAQARGFTPEQTEALRKDVVELYD